MFRRWQKPGTEEVRYYIDTRYSVSFLPNNTLRLCSGRWIGAGDDGLAHVYAKPQSGNGRCRSDDGEWLDRAILGSDPVTFAKWEQTFEACLTKSGNFSVAKYMKL